MQPLPETREAMDALTAWGDSSDLLGGLLRLADAALEIVPDLVGVSLGRLKEGLTFTVVASDETIAVLDAVQYVRGGPCVRGGEVHTVQHFDNADVLDEERWRLFAEATAAHHVRSTLTLPLSLEDDATGSVNLYAASGRAFVGHEDQLAAVFGAWAGAAVRNADLAFTTRDYARATPDRIREMTLVQEAVGLLAARYDTSIEQAEQRLFDAAAQAGITAGALARTLIRTLGSTAPPPTRRPAPEPTHRPGAEPQPVVRPVRRSSPSRASSSTWTILRRTAGRDSGPRPGRLPPHRAPGSGVHGGRRRRLRPPSAA